jgi:Transposase zinc-binding domain
MPLGIAAEYRPRNAEHGVLYRVIDEHLETFLDAAAHHADGSRLPAFVEQEFRDFLACGVLERGFARLRCGECAFERLVPFSCKGRGFCPSCGGRRMTECAARLVDDVRRLRRLAEERHPRSRHRLLEAASARAHVGSGL